MNGLFWIDLFVIYMLAMIILVPRPAIIRLLPAGVFGGFGQAIVTLGLLVTVFGLWRFNYDNVFALAGIPVFIALAWIPEVIVFSYYLEHLSTQGEIYAYLTAFSMMTALFIHWLYKADFLTYHGWNSFLTIPVAFLLHLSVAYYVIKIYGPSRNGTKEVK